MVDAGMSKRISSKFLAAGGGAYTSSNAALAGSSPWTDAAHVPASHRRQAVGTCSGEAVESKVVWQKQNTERETEQERERDKANIMIEKH